MNGLISFNSNSLQTYDIAAQTGIITNVINHGSIPDKVANLYQIANSNSSAIPFIDYPSKAISISGVIKGSDQEDLDTRIDTFKGYFNGKNHNLDINYKSTNRRYTATATNVGISERTGALLYVEFTVEFICTKPFGKDIIATEIANVSGNTLSTVTFNPVIGGNAPEQLPITTITLNAITGSGDYVQLSNDGNDQKLLVFGKNLQAGDVIVIDGVSREVTINSQLVDFEGSFLEFEPGAQSLTYTDGFDSRNSDILIEYQKQYL